jgi:predicted aminopeptidase
VAAPSWPRPLALLVISIHLLTGTGCYYAHLAEGQVRVLWARQPVDDVLADAETAPELRAQLQLVERARRYAAELGLDVAGQYTSYVPWPSDRMVTSLILAEPGQIEARSFRFPIIGQAPYKGFFDQARAEREADHWREQGLDTCLIAVPAYSTLGWFDDPVTDPMLRHGDGPLVETVIHELVHASVFVASQPDFNEGVASFVGQEASIRFFADEPEAQRQRRGEVADRRALAAELLAVREAIGALYDAGPHDARQRAARADLEAQARLQLATLPLETRDADQVARSVRLNDACLALRGTYAGDIPRHRAVLDRLDGDLPRFIARLREAAEHDDPRAAFFAESATTAQR